MQTKQNERQSKRLKVFENQLRARLLELGDHLEQLRREMLIEDDIDDEATHAFRNSNREFVMAVMERETRNISDIEQALKRIARNEYGVCIRCEESIPDNRLRAIPWTRLCVDCAGGGISRRQDPTLGQPVFGSSLG
jgi:DnaK suppressor protein